MKNEQKFVAGFYMWKILGAPEIAMRCRIGCQIPTNHPRYQAILSHHRSPVPQVARRPTFDLSQVDSAHLLRRHINYHVLITTGTTPATTWTRPGRRQSPPQPPRARPRRQRRQRSKVLPHHHQHIQEAQREIPPPAGGGVWV